MVTRPGRLDGKVATGWAACSTRWNGAGDVVGVVHGRQAGADINKLPDAACATAVTAVRRNCRLPQAAVGICGIRLIILIAACQSASKLSFPPAGNRSFSWQSHIQGTDQCRKTAVQQRNAQELGSGGSQPGSSGTAALGTGMSGLTASRTEVKPPQQGIQTLFEVPV
jgi:hypothetical protein